MSIITFSPVANFGHQPLDTRHLAGYTYLDPILFHIMKEQTPNSTVAVSYQKTKKKIPKSFHCFTASFFVNPLIKHLMQDTNTTTK